MPSSCSTKRPLPNKTATSKINCRGHDTQRNNYFQQKKSTTATTAVIIIMGKETQYYPKTHWIETKKYFLPAKSWALFMLVTMTAEPNPTQPNQTEQKDGGKDQTKPNWLD